MQKKNKLSYVSAKEFITKDNLNKFSVLEEEISSGSESENGDLGENSQQGNNQADTNKPPNRKTIYKKKAPRKKNDTTAHLAPPKETFFNLNDHVWKPLARPVQASRVSDKPDTNKEDFNNISTVIEQILDNLKKFLLEVIQKHLPSILKAVFSGFASQTWQ